MQLIDIVNSGNSVAFVNLGAFKDLVVELQTILGRTGLLDPPADGKFGQVSKWALNEAVKALKQAPKSEIDAALARALLDADPASLLPIKPKADFAGKIASYMMSRNLWLNRHPACVNIVYVEGSELDGTANANVPNQFNDVRAILRVAPQTGVPEIVQAWEATTEPGRFYTEVKLENPGGAARIGFGQYKSWAVGMHGAGNGAHEALVQVDDVTVYRDANRDYKRAGDLPDTGMFGINQHWGYDLPRTDIQNASAGCLVGRLKNGHREFMKLVKDDQRYLQNHGYRFMTTVIDRSALN